MKPHRLIETTMTWSPQDGGGTMHATIAPPPDIPADDPFCQWLMQRWHAAWLAINLEQSRAMFPDDPRPPAPWMEPPAITPPPSPV